MVRSAKLGKEVAVVVSNEVGRLADISKIAADHGINIEGIAGYAVAKEARIMLVVEETTRIVEALKKAGYKDVRESEVIIVDLENKPGALKVVSAKLAAEKIDIRQLYGTAYPSEAPARIIFSTSNNEKALVAFRK